MAAVIGILYQIYSSGFKGKYFILCNVKKKNVMQNYDANFPAYLAL